MLEHSSIEKEKRAFPLSLHSVALTLPIYRSVACKHHLMEHLQLAPPSLTIFVSLSLLPAGPRPSSRAWTCR